MPIDDVLRERLLEVGLDPDAPNDPETAWDALHARFGRRITLIDRYALEAHARGIEPDQLDPELRAALGREVVAHEFPAFEWAGPDRAQPDPVALVPPRDDWPQRYAGWRERLAGALGPTALRIEHVGSTSVAGLAAKPVVDIQVSVAALEAEGDYVPAIEGLGVDLRSRDAEHRYFRPGGTRVRDVQVHVCEVGSTWERDHLLFRDYLRAHPVARDRYGALKLTTSERYADDRLAYTAAKTGLILDLLEDAEGWAAETGWRP